MLCGTGALAAGPAAIVEDVDASGVGVAFMDYVDVTESRPHADSGFIEFTAKLDVVEPLGMETMVYFTLNGTQVCARVNPSSALGPGQTMELMADMNHMHLINPETDLVI